MKTKKNMKSVAVAPKTSLTHQEGLAVLADIHTEMESLNKQMAEHAEKDDATSYGQAKAAFDRIAAQFNYFLSQLPPVKFDDRQGTYFIGKDETTGLDVYRAKVSRTYEGYVDVPAASEGAATLAVLKLYGERAIEMKKVGKAPVIEFVGVPVERI